MVVVEEAFQKSPGKSMTFASVELNVPQTTIKILRVKLHERPSKIHVLQMLQVEDYSARLGFCEQFKLKVRNQPEFLEELTFLDESTFHISGEVDRQNCHI